MLIEPTQQAKLQAKQRNESLTAKVIVSTTSSDRILKPLLDDEAYEEAAALALAESFPKGYTLIEYVKVTEYITSIADGLEYRYVWEYDAHKEQA